MWDTSGIILLEKPLFYVGVLLVWQAIFGVTEILSGVLLYILDWVDDIGVIFFVALSFFGNFMNYLRERRIQRELLLNMQAQ